jgi:hypothetical protein
MRTALFLLLFASVVSAQSQSVPCGSSSAPAANAIPTGGKSSVAAKDEAAQIQRRRPAPTRPSPSCQCGTVNASSLTAKSNSQEVSILTALSGSFRFDHVLLQETRRFESDSVASLRVGVGRANREADIVSPLPLKSDSAPSNFWYERPSPPQLTGAYDLVLNFKASAPLGDGAAASNLSAGTVAWEVCGYNAQ